MVYYYIQELKIQSRRHQLAGEGGHIPIQNMGSKCITYADVRSKCIMYAALVTVVEAQRASRGDSTSCPDKEKQGDFSEEYGGNYSLSPKKQKQSNPMLWEQAIVRLGSDVTLSNSNWDENSSTEGTYSTYFEGESPFVGTIINGGPLPCLSCTLSYHISWSGILAIALFSSSSCWLCLISFKNKNFTITISSASACLFFLLPYLQPKPSPLTL